MGKSKEITVTISNMEENPEKISPIIGYFSSGYNPPLNAAMPKVTVSKNKNVRRRRNNNRYEVVVSPNEQSQVKFVGTNYSGEATAPQVSTYALGILDKSTATLKLLPITANKIFRLEPRFAELEDKGMEEVVREEEKKDMYISKKNIRANKKRALLHDQHDDPEIQKDIDKKIEGLQIQINEEQITTTNYSRNIPPHDMDATSSNLIYPLNKIIFNGEWDHLMDIFDIGTTNIIYPKFVCSRVYKLDHVQDEREKRKLGGILSYITHLIKFKDKHSMEGVSSSSSKGGHKIPSLLFQKFSSMFSDDSGGSKKLKLAKDKLDLLIRYVLVLSLFVDDFRSDPLDIAGDLRMSSMKLRGHYELLGCKLVRGENQVLLATLPAPLHFTTKYNKRRKRY